MKIAINGACGRMGQAVEKAALDAKIEVAQKIDVVKADGISRTLTKKVDALIDFSTPEAALERLAECVKAKTAAVICTTGFSDAQQAEIAAAAKKIAVVYSSNMSVGVNLLFKRVPEIAKTLARRTTSTSSRRITGSRRMRRAARRRRWRSASRRRRAGSRTCTRCGRGT
jgi:4-hydroxy-tetrahydrodipicolinate reductase